MLDTILAFDHSVIFAIQNHLIASWLTPIMYGISKITESGALWILIAIILMLTKKYRTIGAGMFLALVFVFIIGDQGLKPHVARLRPFVDFPNVPLQATPPAATSYSFPSGHSFGSFSASMALFIGLSAKFPKKAKWGVIALIFSCIVAFSRVYLFVHYPTDVLAGFIMGIIVGFFAWCIALHVSKINSFNWFLKNKTK